MKLFVWHNNVLCDHLSGIAIALADDVDQARKILANKIGYISLNPEDFNDQGLLDPPDEILELDKPYAIYKYGSM